jgi:hypothetical protein
MIDLAAKNWRRSVKTSGVAGRSVSRRPIRRDSKRAQQGFDHEDASGRHADDEADRDRCFPQPVPKKHRAHTRDRSGEQKKPRDMAARS